MWAFFRALHHPELSIHSGFLYFRDWVFGLGPVLLGSGLIWIYFFRRGFFQLKWVAYLWLGLSVLGEIALSVQNRGLMHLSLSLAYFVLILALMRGLDRRVIAAANNPSIRWIEGTPKVLPHIQAWVRLSPDEDWKKAAVRKMDHRGLFVWMALDGSNSIEAAVRVHRPVYFRLEWKGLSVEGVGKLQSKWTSPGELGLGLQFLPKGMYHEIQYTALVEGLRGEGYAITN